MIRIIEINRGAFRNWANTLAEYEVGRSGNDVVIPIKNVITFKVETSSSCVIQILAD